jgi:hypothetical protein
MKLGSWADQFSRDTILKDPDPKEYARALGEKELVIYFTKERVLPKETMSNQKYFGFITYLADLIERMFAVFRLDSFLLKADFEGTIGEMLTFLVCEKRFALQTWCDPSTNALFMETILFSLMRVNKYLIYFHEQLTGYCARKAGRGPGLSLTELERQLPVDYCHLTKLCEFVQTATRRLVQKSKAKFKKGFPFGALLKLNSQMAYYFGASSDLLKATILGDNTWNRMSEVLQNVDLFLSTGNILMQLAETGEFHLMSRTNTQNSDDDNNDDADGFQVKSKNAGKNFGRDTTFKANEVAKILHDKEEETREIKRTEDELSKGLMGSVNLFRKIDDLKGPVPVSTGFTFDNLGSFINLNIEQPATDEGLKHMSFEGFQNERALESIGISLEKIFEFTSEVTKKQLLEKVRLGIQLLLPHEKLLDIYGSEFLVSLLKKNVVFEEEEETEEELESPKEEFIPPSLILDYTKLDLHSDSKDHFVTKLNNHIKNRAKELRERKQQLEAKEREEREKNELLRYEMEKRRGGWKTTSHSKNVEGYTAPDAFVKDVVDLSDVTNYTPNMFHYFDQSKVEKKIEDIYIEETFEACIPEEELFGKLS